MHTAPPPSPSPPSRGARAPSFTLKATTSAFKIRTALTLLAPDPLKPIAKEKQNSEEFVEATRGHALALPGRSPPTRLTPSRLRRRTQLARRGAVPSGGRACLRRFLSGGLATIGICWTGEGLKRSSRPKRSGWHSPPTNQGSQEFFGLGFRPWQRLPGRPCSAWASPSALLASLGGCGARGPRVKAARAAYRKEKEQRGGPCRGSSAGSDAPTQALPMAPFDRKWKSNTTRTRLGTQRFISVCGNEQRMDEHGFWSRLSLLKRTLGEKFLLRKAPALPQPGGLGCGNGESSPTRRWREGDSVLTTRPRGTRRSPQLSPAHDLSAPAPRPAGIPKRPHASLGHARGSLRV